MSTVGGNNDEELDRQHETTQGGSVHIKTEVHVDASYQHQEEDEEEEDEMAITVNTQSLSKVESAPMTVPARGGNAPVTMRSYGSTSHTASRVGSTSIPSSGQGSFPAGNFKPMTTWSAALGQSIQSQPQITDQPQSLSSGVTYGSGPHAGAPEPGTDAPIAQQYHKEAALPPNPSIPGLLTHSHDSKYYSYLEASDLNNYPDKPWNRDGADPSDYFNYGFTEQSWTVYRQMQLDLRNQALQLGHELGVKEEDQKTGDSKHFAPPIRPHQPPQHQPRDTTDSTQMDSYSNDGMDNYSSGSRGRGSTRGGYNQPRYGGPPRRGGRDAHMPYDRNVRDQRGPSRKRDMSPDGSEDYDRKRAKR